MPKIISECRACGKEFQNYDSPIAYREFCGVYCNAHWYGNQIPLCTHGYLSTECVKCHSGIQKSDSK
jgi:hypothetical protein